MRKGTTTYDRRRTTLPELVPGDTPDLQVIRTHGSTIVLAGLPPVYAQGLSVVLGAAGMATRVVSDPRSTAGVPVALGPSVVVVPVEQAAVALAGPDPGAPPVVVLVDLATAEVCATALRSGVTGILTVDDGPEDVVLVLQAAAGGRTALPREVVRALCRPQAVVPPALTPTEQAWLRRLAVGGTVAGLARSCGYSEREMYRRLSAVYLRLGASTRTEALLLAERFGLLAPSAPAPAGAEA